MLSIIKQKLIKSLETKKGREKSGMCLVEGKKVIETAGSAVEFEFTKEDLEFGLFDKVMTTDTPQSLAAIARIPVWSKEEIEFKKTIVILDGVQDPGNVGSILRLCLGFDASLILIESADVTAPKVVRSSVGAMFQVPWMQLSSADARSFLENTTRPVFRLEKKSGGISLNELVEVQPMILIAGNEGSGIRFTQAGTSVAIEQSEKLESLNVASAVAIALHHRFIISK